MVLISTWAEDCRFQSAQAKPVGLHLHLLRQNKVLMMRNWLESIATSDVVARVFAGRGDADAPYSNLVVADWDCEKFSNGAIHVTAKVMLPAS